MMQPIVIVATEQIIRDPGYRYVHPDTGEVYGRTDYWDDSKLAEMGAAYLREELPATGYQADGWEIVDDPQNTGWKLRRPTSTSEIPYDLAANKAMRIYQIDAKTRELIAGGFSYGGKQFSMSDAAQKNWLMMAVGVSLGMITAQNIPQASSMDEVPYTFTDMNDLSAFLAAYASYNTDAGAPLVTGRALKAAVVAAMNKTELDAVVDNRT